MPSKVICPTDVECVEGRGLGVVGDLLGLDSRLLFFNQCFLGLLRVLDKLVGLEL